MAIVNVIPLFVRQSLTQFRVGSNFSSHDRRFPVPERKSIRDSDARLRSSATKYDQKRSAAAYASVSYELVELAAVSLSKLTAG